MKLLRVLLLSLALLLQGAFASTALAEEIYDHDYDAAPYTGEYSPTGPGEDAYYPW